MSRLYTTAFFAALIASTAACDDRSGGHSHGLAGGHGHAHPPTLAVTHWTERTELFMEYPVLFAGRRVRSTIHVTDLVDSSPLPSGGAFVTLRAEDGREHEFRDGAARPGIFRIGLELDRPGLYEMAVRIKGPTFEDLHELGQVTVHAAGETPPGQAGRDDVISFLKEQQWTLEFGTAVAAVRPVRPGITVPATIRARPGGDALLTAPVPGRIDPNVDVPVPGTRVRAGAVVTRIAPRSDDLRDAAGLRAALVEAEQAQLLAERERDRADRLVAARALPARRLEEAEAVVVASSARLDAARDRWSRFEALSQADGAGSDAATFALRAPFDGAVTEVRFTAGVSVEADEPLLRIVDPARVHVVGAVPEATASRLAEVTTAELQLDGKPPLALANPLAVSPVIDPLARTAEIRFALDNRSARLRLGRAASLKLFIGDERPGTAIPNSAVVDDGGRPVVFVQVAGESFERRPVLLGEGSDGYVHVLEGLAPGERVVHHGAYLVRLASMSTEAPGHGHVH